MPSPDPDELEAPEEVKKEQANLPTSNGDVAVKKDEGEDAEKPPPDPLATFGETFSFAKTAKVKVCIAIGLFCAAVTGCAFPALAWIFADSFERLSGVELDEGDYDFMGQIKELAFQLLTLGALVFFFMTLNAALLETAAGEMTEAMKTQWFQALLRQDMAYYDITDVSGTATIINTNGKKFRR